MNKNLGLSMYCAVNFTLMQGYVGRGDETRPTAAHTPLVNNLLSHPDTQIRISTAFSSVVDVCRAEAVTIACLASGPGIIEWLNVMGTGSTSFLRPLLATKHGTVRYNDLWNTIVFVIDPAKIDGRGSVTGHCTAAQLADRLLSTWGTGWLRNSGLAVRRGLFVSKKAANRLPTIIADYDLMDPSAWPADGSLLVLGNPNDHDNREQVGMNFDWENQHPSNSFTYSADLRRARELGFGNAA